MFSTWGLNQIGASITFRLQRAYLSAVLRQNVAYFDVVGAGEITSNMDHDMKLIQEGISQKLGLIITGVSGFIVAIIVALVENWLFGLIMLCQPVALTSVIGGLGIWLSHVQQLGQANNSKAENLAQDVLNAIRNVIAYQSQARFVRKYDNYLKRPTALDKWERCIFGLMVAASFTVLHWANSIGVRVISPILLFQSDLLLMLMPFVLCPFVVLGS